MSEFDQYRPTEVSPPGETLEELLRERKLPQRRLAPLLGISAKHLNEIVKGKAQLTPQLALKLENVLGVPAGFWNNRERRYREDLARREESAALKDKLGWLKKVPFRRMAAMGWVEPASDKVEQLRLVLKFFGVADVGSLDQYLASQGTAFRHSPAFKSDQGALAAWLRQGELLGQAIRTAPFRKTVFETTLAQLRCLTGKPLSVFLSEMTARCADAGVALVVVPEIKGTRVFGATRWLAPDKALIQISLRYRYNDNFWFSFFHEAGHIMLHGKKDFFLETGATTGDKELEADRFAARTLIPAADFAAFRRRADLSPRAVSAFARLVGVAPGIIVGRLHHEKLVHYSHLNELRLRLEWPVESVSPAPKAISG